MMRPVLEIHLFETKGEIMMIAVQWQLQNIIHKAAAKHVTALVYLYTRDKKEIFIPYKQITKSTM